MITLLLSWGFNQWFGKPHGFQPKCVIDDYIPVVSWFVYFYYLTFPMAIITYFYLASCSKKDLYNLVVLAIICFAISGVVYYFWQTEMIKPQIVAQSFSDRFMLWTWNASRPTNLLPSQHCFMAIACVIAVHNQKSMKWWYRVIVIVCSIMVVLSTVFIKQHYFLDFVASLAIMVPIYILLRVFKVGDRLEKLISKRTKK